MTSPFIPASAWPGIEHTKASPAAGTVTVPVALFPPSALSFVPSAKVTSWRVEPVFLNSTSYVPAAGTVGIDGVKPRSNASIEIFSACAGDDWGAATAGWAAPVAGRRRGMRPATGGGPGRTAACGQGKGEAGEHRKTGEVAAHLGSPDPFTAIESNTYCADMSLALDRRPVHVPNGPISVAPLARSATGPKSPRAERPRLRRPMPMPGSQRTTRASRRRRLALRFTHPGMTWP